MKQMLTLRVVSSEKISEANDYLKSDVIRED